MTDFEVRFNGDGYTGAHVVTYFEDDRDSAIARAKRDGENNRADEISITYKNGRKWIGCWFRKGDGWYSI